MNMKPEKAQELKALAGTMRNLSSLIQIPETGISDEDLRFLEQAKERLGLSNFMRILTFMPFLTAYRQVGERKINVPDRTIPEVFVLRSFLQGLEEILHQHSTGVEPPRREIHASATGNGLSIHIYDHIGGQNVHISTIPLELRFAKGKPVIKRGKTEFTDEIKRMAAASSSPHAKKILDEIKKRERDKTNCKRRRPR